MRRLQIDHVKSLRHVLFPCPIFLWRNHVAGAVRYSTARAVHPPSNPAPHGHVPRLLARDKGSCPHASD